MNFFDFIRGYTSVRRVEAVVSKDGKVFPPYAVVERFDLNGKYVGASIGVRLTRGERRNCLEHPESVKRSAFSHNADDRVTSSPFSRTIA